MRIKLIFTGMIFISLSLLISSILFYCAMQDKGTKNTPIYTTNIIEPTHAEIVPTIIPYQSNSNQVDSCNCNTSSTSCNKITSIPTELNDTEKISSDKSTKSEDEYNNPIDKFFFQDYPYGSSIQLTMIGWDEAYSNAWEAEMKNAYDVLKQLANPNFNEIKDSVVNSETTFIAYAKSQAKLEASCYFTNGFGVDETGKLPDELNIGSGYGYGYVECIYKLYREQTLILCRIINEYDVYDYSFDVEKAIEEYGLN